MIEIGEGRSRCMTLILLALCMLVACVGVIGHRRVPPAVQTAEQQHFDAYLVYRASFNGGQGAGLMGHATGYGGGISDMSGRSARHEAAVPGRLHQCSSRLFMLSD